MKCTRASHEAMKRNRDVWESLELIGYQPTVDDNDQPCRLECGNCSCGSTLCVEVAA